MWIHGPSSWGVPTTDFPGYWVAGRLALLGRLDGSVYVYDELQRAGQQLASMPHTVLSFTPQPPPVALLAAPLAVLDLEMAAHLWWGLKILCALALPLALARTARVPLWVGVAFLFAGGFFLERDLQTGQVYLPLLLGLTWAVGEVAGAKPDAGGWPSRVVKGVLVGVAASAKLFPGVLLLPWGWRGRGWEVLGAAIGGILAFGGVLWFLGPGILFAWGAVVFPGSASGTFAALFHPGAESLYSLTLQLLVRDPFQNPDAPLHSPLLQALLWGGIRAALILLALAKTAGAGDDEGPLMSVLWLQLALLLSPLLTSYHNLLALLPLAVVMGRLHRQQRWRWLGALGGAWLWFAFGHPHVLVWQHGLSTGWMAPLAFGRLWLNLLIFMAILASSSPILLPSTLLRRGLVQGVSVATTLFFLGGPLVGILGRDGRDDTTMATPAPEDDWDITSRRSPFQRERGGPLTFSAMDWERFTVHQGREIRAEQVGSDLYDPSPGPEGSVLFTMVNRSGNPNSRVLLQTPSGGLYPLSPADRLCEEATAASCRVVFRCEKERGGGGEVWEAEGCQRRVPPRLMGTGPVSGVAISPRGNGLVTVGADEKSLKVQWPGEEGREEKNYRSPAWGRVRRPRFDESGCRVVFEVWPSGNGISRTRSQVWMVDACKDKDPWKVTGGAFRDRDPSFSPSGDSIWVASDRGGGVHAYRLFQIPLPGEESRRGEESFPRAP